MSCFKSLCDSFIDYKETHRNYNYYNFRFRIFQYSVIFLVDVYTEQRLTDPEDITRTISLLLAYIIAKTI